MVARLYISNVFSQYVESDENILVSLNDTKLALLVWMFHAHSLVGILNHSSAKDCDSKLVLSIAKVEAEANMDTSTSDRKELGSLF